MRLRNVPGARETIIENQFSIQQPEQMKGKWHEVFQNDHPIHIEVGMGKGQFIIEMARRNPEVNYIGIEKYSSVSSKSRREIRRLRTGQPSFDPYGCREYRRSL